MRKSKKGWLLNIAVIMAVLTLVSAVIFVLLADAREAFIFGYKPVLVTSKSMEPEYLVGGFVLVGRSELNEIERKDVILFRSSDKLILHRVIEVRSDALITQGDALSEPDGSVVTADELLGKVVWHTNITVGWTWQGAAIWFGIIIAVVALFAIAAMNWKHVRAWIKNKKNGPDSGLSIN
ncbi:signal peptidase I [Candidatus Saccharibacteria bacterium]|nr:signal peptidase I [Candidatus Saccharibacteria bacterium]